jgi:hypothetical protein
MYSPAEGGDTYRLLNTDYDYEKVYFMRSERDGWLILLLLLNYLFIDPIDCQYVHQFMPPER